MKKLLFVLLAACPVWAQVGKKQLTEADYTLWNTLEQEQLSDDGRWACYTLTYESGRDTLVVKHTQKAKVYSFAGGTDGRFAANNHFVYRGGDGAVVVVNLKTGKEIKHPNIGNYRLALSGNLLIMLQHSVVTPGDLLVVAMDGKVLKRIPRVTMFLVNPSCDKLVCDYDGQLLLLNLNYLEHPQLIESKPQKYHSAVWQSNGSSVAYLTEGPDAYLGFYQLAEKKHFIFDKKQFVDFPKDGELYNASVTELAISDDGQKVFFGVKPKQVPKYNGGVQVWNTEDKIFYPQRAIVKDWGDHPKLAVWFPILEQVRMVTDTKFPYFIILPGQEFALVHNPGDNEPQFDRDAPIDYYLQDIVTGQRHLFLSKFSADHNKISFSPGGKYIVYFKEQQWWLYNIKLAVHMNLSGSVGHSFIDESYDRPGEVKVYGMAGWTVNEDAILVYDSFDVWSLKTDGSGAVRLTRGREEYTIFRLVPQKVYQPGGSHSDGGIDLTSGLILKALNPEKSGYFYWTTQNGAKAIVFENNRISSFKKANNGVCVFVREHYHLPPQLVVKQISGKFKVIGQSNEQQKQYSWGFSKRIAYENSKGQLLGGALFYPAGYDADKSYPMVVYIYERKSDLYNQYVNPSFLNQDGFNISNLTTQGYFVLLPDIAYEVGQPGRSAVDCVNSAVNKVLVHESVDKKRIGLMGHSFGGYETSFIVTQTNIFASAISGAGFNDLVSSYLSVGSNNKRQDSWRYEFGQNRMGKPLYEDYEKYLLNSPITFAHQVETPLLLWAGIDDSAIDYRQTLEFHLALRRLRKPNILLLYEKGGHALSTTEQQMDLTRRIMQWWNFYLKGGFKQDWFTPDSL